MCDHVRSRCAEPGPEGQVAATRSGILKLSLEELHEGLQGSLALRTLARRGTNYTSALRSGANLLLASSRAIFTSFATSTPAAVSSGAISSISVTRSRPL